MENISGIMFVCNHNSRRSQIAEAFAKEFCNGSVRVESAGLHSTYIAPEVISVMNEIGVVMDGHSSNKLSEYESSEFDVVVCMCGCYESLPEEWQKANHLLDWKIEDPKGKGVDDYRQVRDVIKAKVQNLLD